MVSVCLEHAFRRGVSPFSGHPRATLPPSPAWLGKLSGQSPRSRLHAVAVTQGNQKVFHLLFLVCWVLLLLSRRLQNPKFVLLPYQGLERLFKQAVVKLNRPTLISAKANEGTSGLSLICNMPKSYTYFASRVGDVIFHPLCTLVQITSPIPLALRDVNRHFRTVPGRCARGAMLLAVWARTGMMGRGS